MSILEKFKHLEIQIEAIESATNNFSVDHLIGEGGFGKVYKGELLLSKGQTIVAIKRLDRNMGQGDSEFWKEVIMLSIYKHPNIVSLLGYCDENDEKILVYEFASNKSLDLHLGNKDLTWVPRLKICIQVARGLAYLHNPAGTQQRVLHRDIKSSNILLDENWNARIADLGLSKFGPANQPYTFVISNNIAGTIGYCDPQYLGTGILTKESDVYSFGVVLFEVLCGRLCLGQNDKMHSYINDERIVKKLRLSKVLTMSDETSVLDVCKRMAARRVNVAIFTDTNSLLCGIVTGKDIATKVVAEKLSPHQTTISKVMTKNPIFVSCDSLAMDTLQKMIRGKFRHLPVVENGEVIASLDIENCLYDVIYGIEKTVERESENNLTAPSTFVETLSDQKFRSSLSTIVTENSKVAIVMASDPVYVAAKRMKELQVSSVIIMAGNIIQGILTSKDLLMRVVAQNLPPELTFVEKVMTPNPKCATVDTTILEALHIMHDGKFLHLPVIDKDGSVVACLDVLQITHVAISTVSSIPPPPSLYDVGSTTSPNQRRQGSPTNHVGYSNTRGERMVKMFRLSKVLTMPDETPVLDVCRRMAARRVNVAIFTDANSLLCGIVTGKDIATRVVAEKLSPHQTIVSKIMTKYPIFVSSDSLAMDTLQKMIQGKFRHLPVVENGEVIGSLDIKKCLNDVISGIEKTVERESGNNLTAPSTFVETLSDQKFQSSLLTIITENSKVAIVMTSDPVYVAAKRMKELHVSSVIIMDGNIIQGILTSKDLLMRVVAQNLPPELTFVEKVMTPNPKCATVDTTILEALHIMHDGKFLHLPVLDKDGSVVACLDVFQITHVAISMGLFDW
ncbi:unnamed protein product [Lactuca saligna]|uniref:Protein kinase domain-containing protein n=1 Tax=Lactuca saligna TaxID=75948 RepID=A0AA35VZ92_LACSI|nr:unnamed protein product [Lactuca saligna]